MSGNQTTKGGTSKGGADQDEGQVEVRNDFTDAASECSDLGKCCHVVIYSI